MTPAKYQLTALRGGIEVLRQGFGDREEADKAIAEALAGYLDCEIKLNEGSTVIFSAGPAAPYARPRPW